MPETLSNKKQKKQKMVFAGDMQPYLPATLRKWPSGWMLIYYVENPETKQWERKRKRVNFVRNHFQTEKGAIHHVSKMIKGINQSLEKGYDPESGKKIFKEEKIEELTATIQNISIALEDIKNRLENTPIETKNTLKESIENTNILIVNDQPQTKPSTAFVNQNHFQTTKNEEQIKCKNSKSQTLFKDIIDKYIVDTERNNASADTIRSYKSFVSILNNWLTLKFENIEVGAITSEIIVDFMDYVYNERKGLKGANMSNRTYNNYIKNGSAFFSWLVEKRYCDKNLFSLKLKKTGKKRRVLIPPEYRDVISAYMLEKKPIYLVVLKLIFNSLIRPKEIRGLIIDDICLEKKFIRIRGENAKNGRGRNVPMTPDIYEDFKLMELHKYNKNFYVFGKELKPGADELWESYFRKFWAKMRKELDLPEEMVQYSLRDSGMVEMIKGGIDQLSIKQLADHHSLRMTDIYTDHLDPNLGNIIYSRSPQFSNQVNRPESDD